MVKIRVPLLKQEDRFHCGPTVLRMVFQYFDKDISIEEIVKHVGGVQRHPITKEESIRTIMLVDCAKKFGFDVVCYSYNKELANSKAEIKKPSLEDVKKFLKKGLPVILAVSTFILYDKEKYSEAGHFIIITNYKDGKFWYNDPWDGKEHIINEEDLLFAWLPHVLKSSAYLLVLEAS